MHAHQAVKVALELETLPHYTQNLHYFHTLREKWLAHYKVVRTRSARYRVCSAVESVAEYSEEEYPGAACTLEASPPRASGLRASAVPNYATPPVRLSASSPYHIGVPYEAVETPQTKALRALAEAGYPNLRERDLARLLPPDQWEEELIVMADVRAFFHVAYKVSCAHQLYIKVFYSPEQRIIDHIPLTIEHGLHHALANQLSQSLLTSLLTDVASGHNFSERMNELVSEDTSIAEKRNMLSTRKKRLSDIRQRLMTFSNSV